jgi:adenylylsulfate kinase
MDHIHPDFERIVSKEKKEERLNQKAKVFWFTGLSGSGKSTIAEHFEKKLFAEGFFTQVLDGDNIRSGINSDLGFGMEERKENIRRISEIAKLYTNTGIVSLVSFISPTIKARQKAKEIIGEENFIEVYVNTPLEVCEARDVKGLYKKARAGEIPDFSGISSPYEAPTNPDIEITTTSQSIVECVDNLYTFARPLITY